MKGHRKRLLRPLYTSHDFPEPVNAPATFYPLPKRIDQLRYQYDKLRISSSGSEDTVNHRPPPRRRASIGEVLDKTANKTRRHKKALDSYTPASATTLKEARAARERRRRRAASLNQKEAVLQQRIKNKMALDDWRQESRNLQQQKQYEAIRKGIAKVKVPSPFATAETEDAETGTHKKVHEYNKRLQALLKMNDKELTKKVLKDRELEARIKNHIKTIREQRNGHQTVRDEVEEAKNNLELAHKLHEELGEKRVMEYRLRAFTGDDFVLNSKYYKNNR